MSALTGNVSRQSRPAGMVRYTVKDAERIYLGALCMTDANGEVLNGADTAACKFAGVAQQDVDNAADGETLLCDAVNQFLAAGTGFTAADIGKDVFLDTNNDVALAADVTNQVRCGRIVEVVSATQVWVDPTLPPEGHGDVSVVADPAAATSTDGVAAAASADLAALAAEAEKIGDDARAALAKVAEIVNALQAQGLFVAS